MRWSGRSLSGPGCPELQGGNIAQIACVPWWSAKQLQLPQRLAVGWSGGADSTALLLALQAEGHNVQAWHVDHGWREAAAAEAVKLAEQAEAWGIPFVAARLSGRTQRNREALARQGRYACFQDWSKQYGITTLCLAQHRDDQAETVCMRLLQGAGPAGCRGMWPERQLGDLRIVRPLLHVSGQSLRQALQQAGVRWLEDPSNTDTTIWRNHIRHRLFPAMRQAGVFPEELFMRWQQQAEDVAQRLDRAVELLWQHVSCDVPDRLSLPWQVWLGASAAVRARLLQRCMLTLLGEGVTPGRRHIELVETWTLNSGRGGLDLSRCRIYRQRDRLCLQTVLR